MMLEDGDVLRFDEEGARVTDRLTAGRVLIDGTRTGEIADEVLRDRRHLASDGLVVPVVAMNAQTGALEQTPEIITRGLAIDTRHDSMAVWLVKWNQRHPPEEGHLPSVTPSAGQKQANS